VCSQKPFRADDRHSGDSHKRLCGPLANSCFHRTRNPAHAPDSNLEAAYYKAYQAIQNIVDLLAAA
jgi:hypothetical protein